MSLKARIEAVIYAAEEPVTLAQLSTLFREEALASRAARLTAAEPIADPDAPMEAPAVIDEMLASEPATEAKPASESEPGESLAREDEREGQSAEHAVPSESAAQNSADAEVATPDFAGEPQPFLQQPTESLTPGRKNNQELPPETHPPVPASHMPTEAASNPADTPASLPMEDEREAEIAQRAAARALDREVRAEIRALIDELIADYSAADSGLEIREIAGGFRFATRAEYHDAVRAFVKSLKPPMKLSLQALETLAVIAYKQPVTAPEIGEIRGVDSGGVLGSLVARKLITTAGRKQVIGRPILYKTTREFLLRFGLKDLNELPSIEEFEKMAGELSEPEEAGEELPFAQNEIAAVEENAESSGETSTEISPETDVEADAERAPAGDPAPPEPPVTEPQPVEPEPPIDEPPAEPEPAEIADESLFAQDPDEPAPTSEHDAAGPGSGDPMPPSEEDSAAAAAEEHQR
jgi:segregation and condensation protein B